MTREQVINELVKNLNLEIDQINDDLRFKDDLKLDSLDLVEMVMDIEDQYDVMLDDDVAAEIKTVGDLIKAVENLNV